MPNSTTPFLVQLSQQQSENWIRVIDSKEIFLWIDNLFALLFPENKIEIENLERLWQQNKADFELITQKIIKTAASDTKSITETLYVKIPSIYDALQQDASAILNTDPASDCIAEIINTYPGFLAIAFYRISHAIAQLDVTFLPRIISEYAHSKTGIDIHPNATIAVPFVIDHGTGIVIGETCVIGKNVTIYQGVTLGALQVEKSMEEKKRHPTVEDHVIIYANATILGGSTIIGNNSVIGGNTFITKSVEPFSMVMQASKNNIINTIENQNNNFYSI